MKKVLLLSANNVDTNITAEVHPDRQSAYDAMKTAYESTIAELSGCDDEGYDEENENDDTEYDEGESCIEADITEDGASVFGGYDGADMYYWNIQEIEV